MERRPVIAIPGGDEQRAAQIGQYARRQDIFFRRPVVGEVARVNDNVRQRIESIYIPYAPFKIPNPGRGLPVVWIQMGVGNLDNYHRSTLEESVISQTRALLPVPGG